MSDQHGRQSSGIIDVELRILLMAIRQALIMAVAAIEKYLGIKNHKTTRSEFDRTRIK